MALSMTNDIVAADIAGMAVLLHNKIWVLKGFNGDDLVLKYEQIASRAALKSSSPVLKAIDPTARMKPLKESEVGQLRLAVAHQYNLQLDPNENDFRVQLFMLLQRIDAKNVTFTKMEKQIVMGLDVAIKRQLAGRGDKLRSFVEHLTAKGGLEALGKVAAGDMVMSNEDRFKFSREGRENVHIGDHCFSLKIINNVGNVVVTGHQGHLGPSLLDYIDPGNKLVAGNWTVQQLEKSLGNPWWTGRHLMKSSRRKAVADRIVDDLDVLLTPPPNKPGLFSKLGRGARGRIVDGMEEGYRLIMRKLQPLSHTGRLSITMDSAYKLLLVESDLKF